MVVAKLLLLNAVPAAAAHRRIASLIRPLPSIFSDHDHYHSYPAALSSLGILSSPTYRRLLSDYHLSPSKGFPAFHQFHFPRMASFRASMCYETRTTRVHHASLTFRRTHMGHSHDHSHEHDSGEAGERVSRIAVVADICLTVGKACAGYVSGSTAVIADAAHSLSDVVLSGVAFCVYKAARAPKDKMHPYGHGKFETLGALGISSILIFTGVGIGWHSFEAIQGFLSSTDNATLISSIQSATGSTAAAHNSHSHAIHHHGIDIEHEALALSATIISICVKECLYWITKRVGDERGSELLKANAWHHRSDAISSVIALLGVGGAMLGWNFLDPVAGLLVSCLIIRAGLQTGYQSLLELVDSALDESVLCTFKETVMSVRDVKGCHALRGRRAGSSIHLDVHIEVDPWLSVSAAHMVGETVREKLKESHSSLDEIFIHIDPANVFSTHNSSSNVNIAQERPEKGTTHDGQLKIDTPHQDDIEAVVRAVIHSNFAKTMTFERCRCHFLQGRLFVELEVSMQHTILIRDAMKYAQLAEQKIMNEYPDISGMETQLKLSGRL